MLFWNHVSNCDSVFLLLTKWEARLTLRRKFEAATWQLMMAEINGRCSGIIKGVMGVPMIWYLPCYLLLWHTLFVRMEWWCTLCHMAPNYLTILWRGMWEVISPGWVLPRKIWCDHSGGSTRVSKTFHGGRNLMVEQGCKTVGLSGDLLPSTGWPKKNVT